MRPIATDISDFETLRQAGQIYVDKTAYFHRMKLRGDSPSFEAVTAVVSRAFRDGALSCAISERASPPAVSFRRHLPVKLSHWHRPTDSVGRLLVCPPRRTGPYAACLRGSSQMNARQRFTDRLPAFGKCLGRKSLTFFRKPKSAEM